jgi:hypothetical protein
MARNKPVKAASNSPVRITFIETLPGRSLAGIYMMMSAASFNRIRLR